MPCAALMDYCDAGTLICACGQVSCLVHGHRPSRGDDPDCPWRRVSRPLRVEDLPLSRWRGDGDADQSPR
jgi:hypothetical protein